MINLIYLLLILLQTLMANTSSELAQKEMNLVSRALSGEINTLLQNLEISFTQLEEKFIDPRESTKITPINGVIAIGLGTSFFDEKQFTSFLREETIYQTFNSEIKNINTEIFTENKVYFTPKFSPIIGNYIELYKSWKKYKTVVWLEPESLITLSNFKNLVFQDFWLLTEDHFILFHEQKELFGKKLKHYPFNVNDIWEGNVEGSYARVFHRTVPKTNMVLLAIDYTSSSRVFSKNFSINPLIFYGIFILILSVLLLILVKIGFKKEIFSYSSKNSSPKVNTEGNSRLSPKNLVDLIMDPHFTDDMIKAKIANTDLENTFKELTEFSNYKEFSYLLNEKEKYISTWISVVKLKDKIMKTLRLLPEQVEMKINLEKESYQIKIPFQLIILSLEILGRKNIKKIDLTIDQHILNIEITYSFFMSESLKEVYKIILIEIFDQSQINFYSMNSETKLQLNIPIALRSNLVANQSVLLSEETLHEVIKALDEDIEIDKKIHSKNISQKSDQNEFSNNLTFVKKPNLPPQKIKVLEIPTTVRQPKRGHHVT